MIDSSEVLPRPPSRASRVARTTIEWVVIIAIALLVAFVVKTFLIQAFVIPSESMQPALTNRDRVLVNKLSYKLHDIHRGDVVVFERPDCAQDDATVQDLIKRVVGLESETVEGKDGGVFINERRLPEAYLPEGVTTANFGPVEVPPGHVWVMGDNRGNSKDSRFLCGGTTFIPESKVVGRAFVKVWPPNDFGLL